MSNPGSTTMEAHPVHRDVRGEHSSLVFTSAGDVAFAMRTTLAGLAALYTAMWLQLDTPRWAIWTVFIVSPPVRGNALRKTAARLDGTAIGCTVGIVLVALFPQQPAGFYVSLSVFLAVCAYWATLRRGYVAYAAILAAFTSAIVSAGVSAAPLNVWQTATDRGSATVLGVLFALFASNVAARSDDAPGEHAKRIRALAVDLLDWAARQLQPSNSDEPKDAPLTTRILGLADTCTNAIAERPALNWVKTWIEGIPTALVSFQSAVLGIRDATSRGGSKAIGVLWATDAIDGVAVFLRSPSALDLPSLRRQRATLAGLCQDSLAQAPATKEILDALAYLLAGLEAILTLSPPEAAPAPYPRPIFAAHRPYAMTNAIRALVGILLGFLIWYVTAWSHGSVFMILITVALVIFVNVDNPLVANIAAIIGSATGCLVGLAAKYFILIRGNAPLNLLIVLFPLVFFGAWIETRGKLGPLGVLMVIGMLLMIEPANPQAYNFVNDVNSSIAIEFAFIFVLLVFSAIGAPQKGTERILALLTRMRKHRLHARFYSSRAERLGWETRMYDELQRLQAVTKDPGHRRYGVNLLLSGLKARHAVRSAPAGFDGN
jgi:uncharacterized membrane protein YccC